MTQQPTALRLADELQALHGPTDIDERAAAELRRMHEENAQARRTSEYWKAEHIVGNARIITLEAALRQAVEALEHVIYWDNGKPEWEYAHAAITAAKQVLREQV